MDIKKLESQLLQTLDDQRMSRGEKQALSAVFAGLSLNDNDRAYLRNKVFEIIGKKMEGRANLHLLEWLEKAVKVIEAPAVPDRVVTPSRAFFSPQDDCPAQIVRLFNRALREVQVCVFTITDDRIASAILEAHHRGVSIRIITDDDKAFDPGSDVDRMAEARIPVRIDRSEAHMHHKFALFDQELLLTGSYNWTRGAARRNQDNFLVTGEPGLVKVFSETFEELWEKFA